MMTGPVIVEHKDGVARERPFANLKVATVHTQSPI